MINVDYSNDYGLNTLVAQDGDKQIEFAIDPSDGKFSLYYREKDGESHWINNIPIMFGEFREGTLNIEFNRDMEGLS